MNDWMKEMERAIKRTEWSSPPRGLESVSGWRGDRKAGLIQSTSSCSRRTRLSPTLHCGLQALRQGTSLKEKLSTEALKTWPCAFFYSPVSDFFFKAMVYKKIDNSAVGHRARKALSHELELPMIQALRVQWCLNFYDYTFRSIETFILKFETLIVQE